MKPKKLIVRMVQKKLSLTTALRTSTDLCQCYVVQGIKYASLRAISVPNQMYLRGFCVQNILYNLCSCYKKIQLRIAQVKPAPTGKCMHVLHAQCCL
jgi:hypothetical protein